MPEITLRGNKQAALTYAELDENFTAIGLSHGMDTTASNVAISVDTVSATTGDITTGNIDTVNADDIDVTDKIVINKASGEHADAKLFSSGPSFRSNILERMAPEGQANSGLVSVWLQTDFSELTTGTDNEISNGKGAGAWSQLIVDDGNGTKQDIFAGGIQWKTRNVTDLNNYETHCSIHTYTRTNGGNQTAADMLTIGKSETKFENTDRVAMYAPLKLAHYTNTEISALTGVQNGTIVFNTSVNQFQGWDGSDWVNLGYTG